MISEINFMINSPIMKYSDIKEKVKYYMNKFYSYNELLNLYLIVEKEYKYWKSRVEYGIKYIYIKK